MAMTFGRRKKTNAYTQNSVKNLYIYEDLTYSRSTLVNFNI